MHPFFLPTIQQRSDQAGIRAKVAPLPMLAIFESRGKDTLPFLQGQLTNDIVAPGVGQSRLAGYCTAQGRLLATMVLGEVPTNDDMPIVRGLIRKDILAPVLKRLGMFVLRSKVAFSQSDLEVVGVSVALKDRLGLEKILNHVLPEQPWETSHTDTGTWIAAPCPDAGLLRWWWIAGEAHHAACVALGNWWTVTSTSEWENLDIQTGLPWIEATTQDLFIPQTLNLDLIGGVSFTKGCYPGQEIVARSHYRGTVKKRMGLGRIQDSSVPLIPGADVFDGTHPDQPCGRLINVASDVDAQTAYWVLFESSFDAYDHQQLRAMTADGSQILTESLPYSTRPPLKSAD
jgi:tRNA-modifying protein YgfZ